jgi:hypothetical protein
MPGAPKGQFAAPPEPASVHGDLLPRREFSHRDVTADSPHIRHRKNIMLSYVLVGASAFIAGVALSAGILKWIAAKKTVAAKDIASAAATVVKTVDPAQKA